MPIFDYECERCKQVKEFLILDAEIPICLKCNIPLKKIISYKTTFQLKGSGWFRDGYSDNRKGK